VNRLPGLDGRNGAAALLFAALLSACAPQPPPAAGSTAPPSILLVTIDTMRADRLGRGFTPALDRLAAGGLNFTDARSAVPLTLPSHATILSGRLPQHHGVRENATYRFDRDQPTIATLLRARGYRTGAVVGAFVLDRQFGLDAGFETYDDRIPRDPDSNVRLESERRAGSVTENALALARTFAGAAASRGASARPFFLWVHYYDPHAPYDPPPAFRALAGGDPYNGEIAYVDAEFDRLLRGLAALHLTDRLAIVVAGDHGESLGEHGERTHGMLLYEPALRVPLIVKLPGGAPPARRTDPVSLVDIAPTLLAVVGAPRPAGMDGIDLTDRARPGSREVYAETDYPRAAGWAPLRSLVADRWKVVRSSGLELYDVERDPGETRDVAAEHPAAAAAMDARLRTLERASRPPASAPDAEAQARLRSLGYVAASPSAAPDRAAASPAKEIAAWGEFEDALTLVASGQVAAALPRLEALAARYPGAQVFETTCAQARLDQGQTRQALAQYRAIVTRWPGDAILLHDLAVAARRAGQAAEALRAEQAALVVDPGYPAALNGLGLLQVEAGHAMDAAASFERTVSLAPSEPSYWTNLANARREAGDPGRAAEAYERALAIDGTWPDAANGLGVLLVQQGRFPDAIPWFEKALAREASFTDARLNLGIALQQAGQVERAKSTYRMVLAAPGGLSRQKDAAAILLRQLR
jgi:arylsulfatase A-like enzyme/Flp pilus assembly protein TadD